MQNSSNSSESSSSGGSGISGLMQLLTQPSDSIPTPTVGTQNVTPQGVTNSAGYVSPFSQATGLKMGRTDQGVDATVKPGSPITAMSDGVVMGITKNWFKGQPMLWYKVTSGPQTGKHIYISEGINPTVKPGDVIKAGQTIATANAQPTGIETGFAKANGQVLTPYGKSPDGTVTAGGQHFADFLKSVG